MSTIKYALLLVIVSCILFLPGLASLPVIDRDEAHFAQASRQMLQNQQFFQIRFQETTRFQKPPGINWLQAFFVHQWSDADATVIWPYRIPSFLGALFSVLLCFFFARRLLDENVAFWGAIFLASSLLLNVEAHMAVTDAALLCSVLLMQGALWLIYQAAKEQRKAHWSLALLFWLALSLGFVLKGVTPLIGGLSSLALCVMDRRYRWLRDLRPGLGVLLFLGLTFAWSLAVDKAEHSHYLLQMFHHDLLPKLKGGHESHGQPPLFHLLLLPLTFWPVSLFLWQAVVYAVQQCRQDKVRFLLAWIIPTWVFFEIMPTKLPQYVLPTFPAIALLCSLALEDGLASLKLSRFFHLLQGLWLLIAVGLSLSFIVVSYYLTQHVSLTVIVLVVLMMGLSSLVFYFARCADYPKVRWTILLLALTTFPLIFAGILPELEPLWLSRRVAMLVAEEGGVTAQHPLLVLGYNEPSIVFYLNTKAVRFVDGPAAETRLCNDSLQLALVNAETYSHLKEKSNCLGSMHVLKEIRGYDYSVGRWVTLQLVTQNKEKKVDSI